jgi:enoyl-CoA hydratase
MAEYETLLVETKGAVTLVTINRPQALNALNTSVLRDLIAAFKAFDADPTQRCAVLTGSGEKAFAAGADIKEMVEKQGSQFFSEDFFSGWQNELTKPTRKPWIAAVNGFALGGGCELAMMADFIIASDTAKFGQPEIKLGVAPGMGGTQRLTRAVGKAKSMDLMLTGRNMGAEEAERAGLVSRVVPSADLLAEALKAAETIAGMAPLAAMMNKEMVDMAFETTLETGLLMERRMFQVLTSTEDKTEGMTAFVEKRPAVWKNR